MALVLLEFGLITFLSLAAGLLVRRGLFPQAHPEGWLLILLGFIGLQTVLATAHFGIPIGPYLLLGLVPASAGVLFWQKAEVRALYREARQAWKAYSWGQKTAWLAVLAVALMKGAAESGWFDDGLYYTPFIRWSQAQAITPGLGNLHERLAFNSHYHLWTALLAGPPGSFWCLNDTSEWLLVLLAGPLLARALSPWNKRTTWLAISSLVLCLYLVNNHFTAPEADLAQFFFLIALAMGVLTLWDQQRSPSPEEQIQGLILVLGLVTTKLAGIVWLALAGVMVLGFVWQRAWRWAGMASGLVLWAVGVWVGRFILLSGYVLYPIKDLPPVVAEWAIPPDLVNEELRFIESFAKVRKLNAKHAPGLTFVDLQTTRWIPIWLQNEIPTPLRPLGLLALLGLGVMGVQMLAGLRHRSQAPYLFWWHLSVGVAVALWFWKAPAPRFAYGLWALLASYGLAFMLARLHKRTWGPAWLPQVACLGFSTLLLLWGRNTPSIKRYALLPPTWSYCERYLTYQNPEGTSFYMPDGRLITASGLAENYFTQCWDGPLPCTFRKFDNLQLRNGKDFSAGFRFSSQTPIIEGKPLPPLAE